MARVEEEARREAPPPPPSTGAAPPRRRAKKVLSERARAERRLGLLLCAPAVLAMLLVTAYPIGYAVWLSLQRYDIRFPEATEFIGLSNYGDVLSSPLWWDAMVTTLIITVVAVTIELVLGTGLALVMHRAVFGRRSVRTSVLIPYGIVTVVAAFAWQYAFTPDLGFVNTWLNTDRAWLTERWTALGVIILSEVWKTTPFMALLIMAGLTFIPNELYEAARVDGATAWQRFRTVTLPLLKPALMVALLFRALDTFRIFDNVFVMTGGANKTETVSILAYYQLVSRLNIGIGSAVSVLIFLCVTIIAALFIKGLGANLAQQGRR